MSFKLSNRSRTNLLGVDHRLVAVVERAIQLSKVDFAVTEGLRTLETQQKYVAAGKSQTMKSKHLEGKAVDLVAYVGSAISWELNLYDEIAEAMRLAALEFKVPLRWGAAWSISDITDFPGTMAEAMQTYIDERRSLGRRPFIDAPHFELAD